jgi:hypothetical protein
MNQNREWNQQVTILIAKRQYSYVGPSSIIKAYKIDKNRASTDSRHE